MRRLRHHLIVEPDEAGFESMPMPMPEGAASTPPPRPTWRPWHLAALWHITGPTRGKKGNQAPRGHPLMRRPGSRLVSAQSGAIQFLARRHWVRSAPS